MRYLLALIVWGALLNRSMAVTPPVDDEGFCALATAGGDDINLLTDGEEVTEEEQAADMQFLQNLLAFEADKV